MGIVIKTYDVGRADCFLIDLDGFLLLVDGGYAGTMANIIRSNGLQDLDGIILTHIDCDHIAGIISLLENNLFRKKFRKKIISLWFLMNILTLQQLVINKELV